MQKKNPINMKYLTWYTITSVCILTSAFLLSVLLFPWYKGIESFLRFDVLINRLKPTRMDIVGIVSLIPVGGFIITYYRGVKKNIKKYESTLETLFVGDARKKSCNMLSSKEMLKLFILHHVILSLPILLSILVNGAFMLLLSFISIMFYMFIVWLITKNTTVAKWRAFISIKDYPDGSFENKSDPEREDEFQNGLRLSVFNKVKENNPSVIDTMNCELPLTITELPIAIWRSIVDNTDIDDNRFDFIFYCRVFDFVRWLVPIAQKSEIYVLDSRIITLNRTEAYCYSKIKGYLIREDKKERMDIFRRYILGCTAICIFKYTLESSEESFCAPRKEKKSVKNVIETFYYKEKYRKHLDELDNLILECNKNSLNQDHFTDINHEGLYCFHNLIYCFMSCFQDGRKIALNKLTNIVCQSVLKTINKRHPAETGKNILLWRAIKNKNRADFYRSIAHQEA